MKIKCQLQFLGVRSFKVKDGSNAFEVNFYDLESQQLRSFFVGGTSPLVSKFPNKGSVMVNVTIGLRFVPEHRLYRLVLEDIQA